MAFIKHVTNCFFFFLKKKEISIAWENKNRLKTLDFAFDSSLDYYEKREKMIFEKGKIIFGGEKFFYLSFIWVFYALYMRVIWPFHPIWKFILTQYANYDFLKFDKKYNFD